MKTIIDYIKDNNISIDNKYFKVFWKTINHNTWIYLSRDIIMDDMGYKKVGDFYRDTLRRHYQENIDYKEVDSENEIVKENEKDEVTKSSNRGGKNKKYYLVTGKILKRMFLQCRTSNGISLCNYYIDLEQILISYLHYQCNYNNLDVDNTIDLLSNVNSITEYSNKIRKQEFERKIQNIYRIGYVYFIQEEESKNIKIGYSFNIEKRLEELQIANSQKLTIVKYEKCIFPYIREIELHKKYNEYHIRGEWFKNMLKEK